MPEAEERFSYQIPCFKLHYMLVGISAKKDACSLHVMSPALVKRMKQDLRGVPHSGSTIHFAPGEPLPESLIRQIVEARVGENREKAGLPRDTG